MGKHWTYTEPLGESDPDDLKDKIEEALYTRKLIAHGRYPINIYDAIGTYGYARMGRELDKSTQAVHKWFKLSRIPETYIKIVSEKLKIPESDFVKVLR